MIVYIPKKLLTRFLQIFIALMMLQSPTATANECVILLHGLGRTAGSMSAIEKALDRAGYMVWNQGYRSTEADVQTLTSEAIDPAMEFCGDRKIHFVTHSLGGILVRQYLQGKEFNGRIVMISPPNQGSVIPDVMHEVSLFRRLLGPAALQLGTDKASVPNTLDPIQGQIGVIAGNLSSDPWFSWLIPGEDDGKVSVESAKLQEMSDFLVVPNGHTFVMRSNNVIDQVLYFLANGKFLAP